MDAVFKFVFLSIVFFLRFQVVNKRLTEVFSHILRIAFFWFYIAFWLFEQAAFLGNLLFRILAWVLHVLRRICRSVIFAVLFTRVLLWAWTWQDIHVFNVKFFASILDFGDLLELIAVHHTRKVFNFKHWGFIGLVNFF